MVASPVKVTSAKLSGWWVVGGVVGALAIAWAWLTRQGGESIASSLGRQLGASAVGAVGGVVEGGYSAMEEAAEKVREQIAPTSPFSLAPVAGRYLTHPTNLLGVTGRLSEPEGADTGTYGYEVQNQGESDLSALSLTLRVTKSGLEDEVHEIATIGIPAGAGVAGQGTIQRRSITGLIPIAARLYANGYLLDRTDY